VAARSETVVAVGMKSSLKKRLRDLLPGWLWAHLKKAAAAVRTILRRLVPERTPRSEPPRIFPIPRP
jgi:hypothetical protein